MRSRALAASVFIVVASACGAGSEEAPNELPFGIRHVLLISVDTLRADHLGCYGHEFVQSPSLDALAENGVLFTSCISAAPTTLASHTSLFTGTYPHTHGVPRNGFEVHDDNVMLAEVLRRHGFRTAGFVGGAPLDDDVNFHQGFDEYDANFTLTDGLREGIYQRPANEVTNAALDWLDGREAEEHERLFLFLHYYDVHAPYDFPEPYAGMYSKPGQTLDRSMRNLKSLRTALVEEAKSRREGARSEDEEDGFAARLRRRAGPALDQGHLMAAEYAAGVTWTDHHLGCLFDGLRERGLFDQTLIVVTADHGETLLEHENTFDHGASVYDSESHIPLILHFPSGRFGARRIEEVVSNIDVLPTLLSLLGIPAPDAVEGVDVADMFGGNAVAHGPVFTEATQPLFDPRYNDDPLWMNQGKFQSVRTRDFKYMFRLPDEIFRLYDLRDDPDETRNLLARGRELDERVRAELDGALRKWRNSAAPLGSEMTESETQLEALEALGYSGDDEEE